MGLVLVIEDNTPIRELIKVALDAEHLVVEAPNGETALRMVEKVRPNLIILDVNLEGSQITGLDVCKYLNIHSVGVPVLIISGWAQREDIADMFAECATGFLDKPFLPAQLKEAAYKLLQLEVRGLDRLAVAGEDDIVDAVIRAIKNGNSLKVIRALKTGIEKAQADIAQKLE